MLPIILSILLIVLIIFSISITVLKRKRAGLTGMKTAMTPMFLYLVAIMNLLAYWFDFIGIISWSISIILLLVSAYFTKYLAAPESDGS